MTRPFTPEQVAEPPEGYTAEQWDGMKRCAAVLDFLTPEKAAEMFAPATRPESVVYIIRCQDFVKIGTTNDLGLRLSNMRGAIPFDLTVVARFPGDRTLEKTLHARFKAHRHRYEWFRLEGELAAWIEAGCPL